MKAVYFTFILFFFLEISNAQRIRPFEIIEFTNLNPEWVIPVKDTVIKQNTPFNTVDEYNCIDGTTNVNTLIFGNFIFHIKYFAGYSSLGGSLLECIDLATGTLQWQKRYGIYADGYQTALRLMKIDSVGRLSIMGQRKRYPIGSAMNDDKFLNMLIFEDVFDPVSGDLLLTSECTYEEGVMHPTKFNPHGGPSVGAFFYEEENYRYYEFFGLNGQNYLRTFLLNKCGEPIKASVQTEVFDNIDAFNILEIGQDTIMFLSKKYLKEDSTFSFNFKYYTRELVLLDSVLSTPFINYPVGQEIIGLSSDRKKILIKWLRYDNEDRFPPRPGSAGVFDLNGDLLKVTHLPKALFSDFVVLDWENDDEVMVLLQAELRQQNEKSIDNYLVASEYSNNGEDKNILVEYRVADSLKIGVPFFLTSIEPDKWVISLGQSEFYIRTSGVPASDSYGFATLLMLVDKERFTKTSGSDDRFVNHANRVLLFPNPTSDFSTLVWQRPFSGKITITSLEGKEIEKINMSQETQYTLETQNWPPGMYLMRFDDVFEKTGYVKKLVK